MKLKMSEVIECYESVLNLSKCYISPYSLAEKVLNIHDEIKVHFNRFHDERKKLFNLYFEENKQLKKNVNIEDVDLEFKQLVESEVEICSEKLPKEIFEIALSKPDAQLRPFDISIIKKYGLV